MKQKKALVIGGGSDIGSAIVKALHAAGYDVVWTYFHTFRPENPGKGICCDLRDMEQVKVLFSGLFDDLRDFDLMVTAAIPFLESDNFDFGGYLAIRPFLDAHVYAITSAKAFMSHGGRIINMLGQCVKKGLPGAPFYSGAFTLLHNLGKSINAVEGRAGELSVCDFLLGPVETREWDGLSEDMVNEYRSKVVRFISPKQIADTVVFTAIQEVMPNTCELDAYY
ncbi:MAG: SDR family oxidoreductase [Candidatus Moranbacteria bacterium]|nr:SDR family oxidoreductase [Candidatus Moranbacteria bacterium]